MPPKEALKVLRGIIHEWRRNESKGKVSSTPFASYLMQQYRKYQITSEQTCKAHEEMQFMAKSYLCYLQSVRKYLEIHHEFHSKGERSVRDTANIVGFKLPQDPK